MHRILVIDDELGPRESLRILLKPEYEVMCAGTVKQGLELMERHPPDCVISDIRMPGMSGIEGLAEIRARDPDVAVIMLTGYGALETAQEALRLGANDYMKKPFDAEEMRVAVQRQIARTALNRRRVRMEAEVAELKRRLAVPSHRAERMAALGEASAELVHDLRNPLTVVQGYVQLLMQELDRTEKQDTGDCLTEIEKGVRRCRELLDAWQDLGRPMTRCQQAVQLDVLLSETVGSQRRLVEGGRGALELFMEEPAGVVMGDGVQLGRALRNVVSNAVDALGAAEGHVHVSLRRIEGSLQITVTDNGCGIAPEHLERIFEPYFTTKGPERGTGLGLFITRKIIEDHGGSIKIHSRPGSGTTAEIVLPAAQACVAC